MAVFSAQQFARTIVNYGPPAKLAELRGTRSGHCYILADGVSTRYLDPTHLVGQDVIAVGAIPSLEGLEMSRRSFWVFPEPEVLLGRVAAQTLGIVARHSARPPAPFTKWKHFSYFRAAFKHIALLAKESVVVIHISNFLSLPLKTKRLGIFRTLPEELDDLGISNPFAGSLNSAITMAAILGYSEVRLLGFDYLLDPPMSGHWYENRPATISEELVGFYSEFLQQFEDLLQVTHVLFPGQKSQIDSMEYERVLGQPKQTPNTMNPTVRDKLSKSEILHL